MLALLAFCVFLVLPGTLLFASFQHGSPIARAQLPLMIYMVIALIVGGFMLQRAMRQSDPHGYIY
jgi:hypothetical protein